MNEHDNDYRPQIEGLDSEQVALIVDTGIQFLRAITEAYGPEKGQELWESITVPLGDEVRGAVFFSMLTGYNGGVIRVSGKSINKVNAIKAVRMATSMGLKEAKDFCDYAEVSPQVLKIKGGWKVRNEIVATLRREGLQVT